MSGPKSIPFDTGSKLAAGIRVEQAVGLVRTLPILFSCNIFLALVAAAEWRQMFPVEVLVF